MSGCLRIVMPIILLIALAIYCSLPHPTHNQTELAAIKAESQRLMAAYPLRWPEQYANVPKDKSPPVIASLKPVSVTVRNGMVDITMREYFDGGWGYGFASNKRDLTMLVECWSELGHGVYWHDPC